MSHSPETTAPPNPNPKPTRVKRNKTLSLPEPWAIEEALLRQVVSMSNKQHPPLVPPAPDYTSLLSNALLLRIISIVPKTTGNSLVYKRWCRLHGRLMESLTLNDCSFLNSGRVFCRFPNLIEINLTRVWVKTPRNSGIVVSSSFQCLSFHVGTGVASTMPFLDRNGDVVAPDMVDYGLGLIAKNCPNLRTLAVIGATEEGVSSVSRSCEMLQEVELHCCDDLSLNGIEKYAIGRSAEGNWTSSKASLGIRNPHVEGDEFSLSQIWVSSGRTFTGINSIEVGWHVYPEKYDDNRTRIFIFWTNNSYVPGYGCYNMECVGFVQISRDVAFGCAFNNTSTYDGARYDLTLSVERIVDGNWWLFLHPDDGSLVQVGYWPRMLFTHLRGPAQLLDFGGEIYNNKHGGRHTRTQMGSGHFANAGLGRAAYVSHIEMNGRPTTPRLYQTQINCYNTLSMSRREFGSAFYYGGPGFGDRCP